MKFKILLFDCFGTIFDMSMVPREDIRAYVDYVTSKTDAKEAFPPFEFPVSFQTIRPFEGSVMAIQYLQRQGIACVAFSNGPFELIHTLSSAYGLNWTKIIDIYDAALAYKPSSRAYEYAFEYAASLTGARSYKEVGMVTANPKFGDLQHAGKHGVVPILINSALFPTLTSLANHLGSLG